MNFLKLLLLPVSLLYGAGVFLRNLLYDMGVLPVAQFDKPIIAIGNLSAGGTGKSPMTEYLIRLLKNSPPPSFNGRENQVATLSRGYLRHTKGFILADNQSSSHQIGDEPLQFKKKFPELIVAVDESRKHGINTLFTKFPDLKIILLDDAFQHRSVKAGLSILLTDYSKMFYDDFLLPAGTLREWNSGKKRADVIVVTKCPNNLSPVEKRILLKKIDPEPHQHVLFAHIQYGEVLPIPLPFHWEGFGIRSPYSLKKGSRVSVVLLTGVSNPTPLEEYLKDKTEKIIPMHYPDHHEYTMVEVTKLVETFNSIAATDKIIITTEKDAMRLDKQGLMEILQNLPIYYIPIEITFEEKEKKGFDELVIKYITRTLQKQNKIVQQFD